MYVYLLTTRLRKNTIHQDISIIIIIIRYKKYNLNLGVLDGATTSLKGWVVIPVLVGSHMTELGLRWPYTVKPSIPYKPNILNQVEQKEIVKDELNNETFYCHDNIKVDSDC